MSLWNVRALRRFLAKMQTNVYGKLGESFLLITVETVGSQKSLGGKGYFYLCGKWGFSEDSMIKCNYRLLEVG